MEHTLKNGKTLVIRKPVTDDAKALIDIISAADCETMFLARNPGEFCITEEQEKTFISETLNNNYTELFVAELDGKITGMGTVGLVKSYERYRHRAEVSFVILKEYWGMGIGGKLMQQCIDWCKGKSITQIELGVISDNTRAIKLYESFGFKTIGAIPNAMRYPDGSFTDEKLMVLEL